MLPALLTPGDCDRPVDRVQGEASAGARESPCGQVRSTVPVTRPCHVAPAIEDDHVARKHRFAFHRRLGFDAKAVDDFNGPGQATMIVFHRVLPFDAVQP